MSSKKKNAKNAKNSPTSIKDETRRNILNVFENARSNVKLDQNGRSTPLFPDEQSVTNDCSKILMIQQAITESVKKGGTLLNKKS